MDYSKYSKDVRKLIEDCERMTAGGDRKAPVHLKKLEKIAKEREDNELLGFVYFYLANWYYDESLYEKFQSSLEKAIYSLIRSSDHDLLARAYNFFAIDAQSNDALDVAYSYYNSALRFADESRDPNVVGIITHNLASFYYSVEDYRESKRYLDKAIKLMKKRTDDPFYYRNLMIGYINYGVSSLLLGEVELAEKTLSKIKRISKKVDREQFSEIFLPYSFFELRLAFAEGDKEAIKKKAAEILEILDDESVVFVEMDDIKDFCYSLMGLKKYEEVAKILSIIEPHVKRANITHSMRILTEIKIEYYDRTHREKELIEALREQHKLRLRQNEEKLKIYNYSMNLIKIISDLQEEEATTRLENEHLQSVILTDGLTGIPNRYAFDQALNTAFERAYHSEKSLGIGIMDIDKFKDYNDSFGHQVGDLYLERIGEILREVSSEKGIFCGRYGGDEFVMIYEEKTDEEIEAVARHIEEAVRESRVVFNGKPIEQALSVSQGICNDVPRENDKPWDFLTRADDALFLGKEKRKKKIIINRLSENNG